MNELPQCPKCKTSEAVYVDKSDYMNDWVCATCTTRFSKWDIQDKSATKDKPLIDHAVDITSGDRRRDYGRPLINHLRIALEWSNFLGIPISPDKVVWMMIGLKKGREAHTPKFDNLLDTVGYALCLDDMYAQVVELGLAENRDEAIKYMQTMSRVQMTEMLEALEVLEHTQVVNITVNSSFVGNAEIMAELRRRGITE